METNEKELSPQESLDLIKNMINRTKDSVVDNSFYFLFWGWLVFACCIGQYVLKVYLHFPNHFAVWWTMPIGGVITGIYGARQSRVKKVKTFVEDALGYLWIAVALSFAVLVIANMISKTPSWQTSFTYYILLYAIGTFVSGSLIRFKPLIIGGAINFALAAISIRFSYDNQLLIAGFAILISYIIPGHLLRMHHKKQKS
jgi:hypothetical protein